MKFLPDSVVAPLADVLVRFALQIKATDLWRPHAQQGETTFVIGVDQFLGGWRRFRQDTEPSEGILAHILGKNAPWNAGPADAVETIASSNEITDKFVFASVLAVANLRHGTVEIVHAYVLNLKQDLATAGDTGVVQVLEDFRLGIDGDALASGEFLKVNAMTVAIEA